MYYVLDSLPYFTVSFPLLSEFVGRGGQAYADIFSGINWSDPSSFGYGALPCAQTLCYKVENSLMVMLALFVC